MDRDEILDELKAILRQSAETRQDFFKHNAAIGAIRFKHRLSIESNPSLGATIDTIQHEYKERFWSADRAQRAANVAEDTAAKEQERRDSLKAVDPSEADERRQHSKIWFENYTPPNLPDNYSDEVAAQVAFEHTNFVEKRAQVAAMMAKAQTEAAQELVRRKDQSRKAIAQKRKDAAEARATAAASALLARQAAARSANEGKAEAARQEILAKAEQRRAIEAATIARQVVLDKIEAALSLPPDQQLAQIRSLDQEWRAMSGGISHEVLTRYRDLKKRTAP